MMLTSDLMSIPSHISNQQIKPFNSTTTINQKKKKKLNRSYFICLNSHYAIHEKLRRYNKDNSQSKGDSQKGYPYVSKH